MLHKEPMGATVTAKVLAIYFGLLSIQRIPNACWQAVCCGVIFNWEAGSPSSSQGLECVYVCVCVCTGVEWDTVGNWLAFGCRYDYVDAEQQETMLLAHVLIIIAIFGICLQQLTLDFVFLPFFSHVQQWDREWGKDECYSLYIACVRSLNV